MHRLLLTIVILHFFGNLVAQTPAATANFIRQEINIETIPQYPSFCSDAIGVSVTIAEVNGEDVIYSWSHPSLIKALTGQTALLKYGGEWTIRVDYKVNGVNCSESKTLVVTDLNNNEQILKYFENAGFWAVDIYRNVNSEPEPVLCKNCACEAKLENVSFTPEGDKLKLSADHEKFAEFRPFRDLSYIKNISTKSCLCDDNNNPLTEMFEQQLSEADLGLWGHQYFASELAAKGILFVKGKMSWQEQSPVGAHRDRLDAIKDNILEYNVDSTAQQAKVIIRNIFMTTPIGGYDLTPACPDPEGCFAEGNFLTPSGIPVKLPEGSSQFIFADTGKPNGVFEGALIGMKDEIGIWGAYEYKSGAFSGYFHELTATVKGGFETILTPSNTNNIYANYSVKSNGECKVIIKETNLITSAETSYGGISEKIANIDPDFVLISSGFKNVDNETISFLSGNAKIISLPYSQIQDLKFVYNAGIGDIANAATGLLWEFELVDELCNVEKYTFDNSSSYKYEGKVYEDNTNEISIDNFVYLMNCNGQYGYYGINKGSLLKHDNFGENYTNNFNDLTSFFIPFSEENADALKWGLAKINGACSFCPNEEFSSIIIRDNYCTEPEHIIVEKIAQLATVYPNYFKDFEGVFNEPSGSDPSCYLTFTQKTNWDEPITGPAIPDSWWSWSQFLQQNPAVLALKTTDPVAFFKIFIKELKDEKQAGAEWWNSDISLKTVDEITCHLSGEPQAITITIPWNNKLIALNKLYTAVSNSDAQYGIIHLLASSSSEEVKSNVEEKSIQYFWDNFYSSREDDNRSRLVNVVCSKVAGMYVDMNQYYENPASMPQLEANIWNFNNLTPAVTSNFIALNGPVFSSTHEYSNIVPVKIHKKFKIGNETFKEGVVLYVPALQAALYAVKNQSAVNERLAWAALDLGLTAVGVGSYKYAWTGASYLRKGFIAAEITGSVLGVTAQLLDNLEDEERTKIQLAALFVSAPEIGISLVEAVAATRLLRKPQYANKSFIANSADEVRLALAEKDLINHSDAWHFVRTHPRGADAWEMLISHPVMRKDLAVLTKFSELLEPSVINKLPNGIEDLQKIADKLVHPCCGGTHAFMKSLTLHLDDVKFFINNFSGKTGFDQVIKALQHPLFTVQDGTSFMLTKLRTLDPAQVVRFEGKIVEGLADADDLDAICVLCKFDIEVSGGRKLELKSYSSGTINNIASNVSFRNQFKAYLVDANSINDFEYIFNGVKVNDVSLIKGKFREIFEIEATNYFNTFGQSKFENLFGVNNVDDFLTDVIPNVNGSGSIYNFIKIQN